jgi:hypothetical protein
MCTAGMEGVQMIGAVRVRRAGKWCRRPWCVWPIADGPFTVEDHTTKKYRRGILPPAAHVRASDRRPQHGGLFAPNHCAQPLDILGIGALALHDARLMLLEG